MDQIKEFLQAVWPLAIAAWCLINSVDISRLERKVVEDREEAAEETDRTGQELADFRERANGFHMVDRDHLGAQAQPGRAPQEPAENQAGRGEGEPPEVGQAGAQLCLRVLKGAGRLGEGLSADVNHDDQPTGSVASDGSEPEGR